MRAARAAVPAVAALVVGAAIGWGRGGGPPDLSEFREPIEAAARESRVDPDLLRGMIAAESSGNPRARSKAGAIGLMQLRLPTAQDVAQRLGIPALTDSDLENPALNVRLGAGYFRWLLDLFEGEEAFAIAAYNAGPEPVKRWRRRAADASAYDVVMREGYDETRRHLARVLRFRSDYR